MTVDRFEHFSYAISEISRCWRKLASAEMAKYGLRAPHATYLTVMYQHPEGITVPQLCELSGKDKSDASRMISILEKKGLVTKQVSGGSLYRGLLFLTDEGKEAAKQVCVLAGRAVEIAGRDLTEENRAVLYESLDSIIANLNKLCRDGIPK